MRDPMIFFTPPVLTDEAAYRLLEFFQTLALALESHYMSQLRRYSKTLDEENNLHFGYKEVDEDYPF